MEIVLFITDGLPSIGEQMPDRIAAAAAAGRGERRIFTVGVGHDVNTYLLDRLADDGIRPDQVLHVAQSLFHDHVPAKQLGLRTVWVNRRAGKPGSGATRPAQARPDLEVASLAELAQLHQREPSAG